MKFTGELGHLADHGWVGGSAPHQFGQQADGIGGRADVMADGRQETRLADARFFRLATAQIKLALQFLERRNVNKCRHGAGDLAAIVANGTGVAQHNHAAAAGG